MVVDGYGVGEDVYVSIPIYKTGWLLVVSAWLSMHFG